MTAEELYQKEFGNADSIPKESVIRLLKHFAKALKIEREQALHIRAVVGQSEQLVCDSCGCHPNVIYTTSKGRFCERCKPAN